MVQTATAPVPAPAIQRAPEPYDVVVIGGGPGGYVAAIRAAQLGLRTACVEREHLGGVCLNWGCIPSKALIKNAEVIALVRDAKRFGIGIDSFTIDYGVAVDRSRQVVERLVSGIGLLFRKNKIDHIQGEATITPQRRVVVQPSGREITARNIIIATGARAAVLPGWTVDGKRVQTYREAIVEKELPKSLIIVGAGALGMEFAYVYAMYGVSVTIVEMLPHLLPLEDEEVSQAIERSYRRAGITFYTNARSEAPRITAHGVELPVTINGQTQTLEAERVLLGTGFRPNSQNLGLEQLGVALDKRGAIQIDDYMRTNVEGIYAIGDVTMKKPLAHVASHMGVIAAEVIAGRQPAPINYVDMPMCTYCHPQVASFGLTEQQAREQGYDVRVGRFPLQANGKALAIGDWDGFVKIVADAQHGEILGVHMIGPEVTELVSELSLARQLEATVLEVGELVNPHPTLSEAMKEAALAARGQAIHI
jgi:dihydrolipoamide dehydrogenase